MYAFIVKQIKDRTKTFVEMLLLNKYRTEGDTDLPSNLVEGLVLSRVLPGGGSPPPTAPGG